MYADRYARPGGVKTGSLIVAVGINAAVVAALALSSPAIMGKLPDPGLTVVNIKAPPPPPDVPKTLPKLQPTAVKAMPVTVDVSKPVIDVAPTQTTYVDPGPAPIDLGTLTGTGTGSAVTPTPIPPVFVGARIDPRYAGGFQPDYPAGERRMEREGVVHVKVLVGVDGRVKQVERVDATSEAFFRATESQALGKWRFKPATRDGIPVESWRTMSVTFVMGE